MENLPTHMDILKEFYFYVLYSSLPSLYESHIAINICIYHLPMILDYWKINILFYIILHI